MLRNGSILKSQRSKGGYTMSTLGSRLLELRKQKGFTQEQLAEKLNVTNQSVSKWEKDINAPDITLLVELADLLETSVDYLLGRGENKPVVTTTQKNIDQLVFKIRIQSANKDKVNINLPLSIVKLFAKDGELKMLKDKNIDIDINQLIALVEQGIVGELVDIESAGGDTVKITVE